MYNVCGHSVSIMEFDLLLNKTLVVTIFHPNASYRHNAFGHTTDNRTTSSRSLAGRPTGNFFNVAS